MVWWQSPAITVTCQSPPRTHPSQYWEQRRLVFIYHSEMTYNSGHFPLMCDTVGHCRGHDAGNHDIGGHVQSWPIEVSLHRQMMVTDVMQKMTTNLTPLPSRSGKPGPLLHQVPLAACLTAIFPEDWTSNWEPQRFIIVLDAKACKRHIYPDDLTMLTSQGWNK